MASVKIPGKRSKGLPNYSDPVNDSLYSNAGIGRSRQSAPKSSSGGGGGNPFGNGALEGFIGTAAKALNAGIGGGALQGFINLFPKAAPPKTPKKASKPANVAGNSGLPQYSAPSFMDALAQAQALLGGQGTPTVDYSPLMNQTRQVYNDSTNRLLAMYQALHNNFQNDAPGVAGIFDQAKTADQQTADSTTAAINQAYNNARQDQTSQFNALGIGEALANIAANGAGSTTDDQANALSRVATSNQANQNQLDTNKSAALNYNTGIANSALQGGTDRAAQLQTQLASALAQIQQQQQTANAQLASAQSGNITDLASTIYNAALSGQKLTDAEKAADAASYANSNKLSVQQQGDYVSALVNLIKQGKSPQEAQQILSGAGY